ncbi:NADH:ubiquinone oxidoreductase [Ceratobasidium sp. 414]|nr:NADH:ubiquinone oxidoreductase [Ceratobasidium sp. 414]
MATAVIAPMPGLPDRIMNDSPPTTPSNVSGGGVDWEAKYHEVSELLQETRAELDEFQTSSKELEEELERELESTEQQMTDLRNRVERVERERDDCKNKLTTLQGTHNTTVNSLQRELDALRQQHALIKVQLRELEVGNDDLERSEREVSSSLADLEGRYARALEEKILLEHELQDRVALEEDMQRLRDELRDATEESTILKEQNTRLSGQHCALDEQNKSLSEELSRMREELAQARHLVELARDQPQFPSAPSTATSSAKSISSHDSRSPTPSAASRTSSDLQLEDLVPKSAPPRPGPGLASANATPRAKSAIPVSPSTRTMSVTRRPGTGIAVPTVVRTPNGQSALLSRTGIAQNSNGTPDLLRRSTTLPALSSPVPTRLPTARNSPAFGAPPVTPRPRIPNGTSGLGPSTTTKRGTAVQMVGEMRARVRTLEQKINRVPLPRIRNASLRTRVLGGSKENANEVANHKNPESGAESPGWVIVADGSGKGMNDDLPSPSPLPRQPLVERGTFTSERTESKRTSFSSDRSRRSINEDPPPSAFRGLTSPSQTEFPPSGRTTPASTVGSNRVVSRTNGMGSATGRATPGLGMSSSSSLFGMSIRRPQSRNASHGNPTRGGGMALPLPSIPSLSRIPSSPLPGISSLELPGRPATPIGLMMLPVPVDRSPSKSDNVAPRRSTRRLSLHPSGPGGLGSATNPALPAGLTGGEKARATSNVGGTRKPVSPPGRGSVSPPGTGKNGMGPSQSMLGMSRIGRPNSLGLASSRIGAPAAKEKEVQKSGRFRSGSVGWGRER